ncbi:MAG: hypothetical protein ACRC4O_07485 [Giesbergeria sp.]
MITSESLRAAEACWTDERIAEMVPPEGVTARQLVDGYAAAGVSEEDAHWVLCYAAGASDRALREHACWCARQALALVESPDPRSVAAVEVAERFARGEATNDELADARAATWAATCDELAAASVAAWAASAAVWTDARAASAARDAARALVMAAESAARASAMDAARSAESVAGAAVWAAARAAARVAAWAAQVQDLAERIEKEEAK